MKRLRKLPGTFGLKYSRKSDTDVEVMSLFLACRKSGFDIPEDLLELITQIIEREYNKYLSKLKSTPGEKYEEELRLQVLLECVLAAPNRKAGYAKYREIRQEETGEKYTNESYSYQKLNNRLERYLDKQLLLLECPQLTFQVNEYNDHVVTDGNNRILKKLLLNWVSSPLSGEHWDKLKAQVTKYRNTPDSKRQVVSLHNMIEDYLVKEAYILKNHSLKKKLDIYRSIVSDP